MILVIDVITSVLMDSNGSFSVFMVGRGWMLKRKLVEIANLVFIV